MKCTDKGAPNCACGAYNRYTCPFGAHVLSISPSIKAIWLVRSEELGFGDAATNQVIW